MSVRVDRLIGQCATLLGAVDRRYHRGGPGVGSGFGAIDRVNGSRDYTAVELAADVAFSDHHRELEAALIDAGRALQRAADAAEASRPKSAPVPLTKIDRDELILENDKLASMQGRAA